MPNDLSSPNGVLDMPAATTAVLHGMMATLSEVLGGIDGRIAAIERQLREARAESGSPRALAQTVEAAVARLAERIEALESLAVRPPVVDTDLHAAVDALRQSVDALAVRPIRDDALHDAVAQLAARPPAVDHELRAAVADLAARPPVVDDALRAAVAELASRPAVDAELHAMVADLLNRPPAVDHELRAAVADLAARPAAVVDTELHAMVADLLNRPPAVDEALHAAVAALAQRPTRDDELHAAVARLIELASQPPKPAPVADDDPVRLGITSLHERLSVLLELVAQPPKPDDAVRADLAALHEQLATLRDPSPDPALHELGERMRRLEEAVSAYAQQVRHAPEYPEFPDLQPLTDALATHPAAALKDAMERVEQQVSAFVAQPGPGPAMAMVAAGLAERFEARTDSLVDLLTSAANRLDAVALAPGDLAARVEEFVGRHFADLPNTLSALRGDEVIDRIRTVVESQQGDVVAMRDAMRSLFDSIERHGAVAGQVAELLLENRANLGREIDRLQEVMSGHSVELGERVQVALEAAARADAHALEMGMSVSDRIDQAAARLVADVQAMVTTGEDPARLDAVAERISESVRKESELLTQRVASLSVAVDNLRAMLDTVSDEMSNSIGRKATEVGRRLAADLGIKPKKPAPKSKQRSLNP